MVVRRPRCIGDVAARIVVGELRILACSRINQIRRAVIVLVDARLVRESHGQHAALNGPLARLRKGVAARNLDVVVVQCKGVGDILLRSVRRILVVILRLRGLQGEVFLEINRLAVDDRRRLLDIVLEAGGITMIDPRAVLPEDIPVAVVDLVRLVCLERDIRGIDVRLIDLARAVCMLIEQIVPGIAAECRTHRRPGILIADRLIPRILICGERRPRTRTVLARDACESRNRPPADERTPIAGEHRRIGRRDGGRTDGCIVRRRIIVLLYGRIGQRHMAARDGVVMRLNGRSNRMSILINETIVVRMRRIDTDGIVHSTVALTCIL